MDTPQITIELLYQYLGEATAGVRVWIAQAQRLAAENAKLTAELAALRAPVPPEVP